MTAKILDGKQLALTILNNLKSEIVTLPAEEVKPKLVIVQILGDEASSIYVKHKLKAAADIGIEAEHIIFPCHVGMAPVKACLMRLNADASVHGVLLQLPLPPQLSAQTLLNFIDPKKDVDGLTAVNQGLLMQKQPALMPCTPTGIIALLQHYEISLVGKEVVVLNASSLVGRPLALQLLAEGATVTLCNSKTKNLQAQVQRAEILVSATGKPHVIPGSWLSPGSVVVDVGVHHSEFGLIGDVDFASASQVASWITPVPGGVGPMTVAMLMKNVWQAFQ